MAIEDTYPGYSEQIRAARSQGFSDEEIQGEFQSLIREQASAGIPVEQISRGLGQMRQPKSLGEHVFEAVGGPLEAAASVGSQFIGAPIAGLAGLVKAATEAPSAIRERGLVEGIPEAFARAAPTVERTQETLSFQPRTGYGEALARTAMVPEQLAEEAAQFWSDIAYKKTDSPAAAAAVNAAAQFFLDPTNLIFAPAAFKRVKGQAPKSQAEIIKTVREEPAFVEQVTAAKENIPPEMAERIGTAQKEGFTPEEIGQALAEIEPAPPSVEPSAKGPEFFSTLKELGYSDEALRTMPFAEKVRRARERVPAETEVPQPETATIAPETTIEPEATEATPTPETQLEPESVRQAPEIEALPSPLPERFTPTPEEQARFDAIVAQRKPWRIQQGSLGAAVERQIDNLTAASGTLEFKGQKYTAAIREGRNVRLKDHTDKVLKKPDDILRVEIDDASFNIPPEETGGVAEPAATLAPAPEDRTTSIKNAVVDQELAAMGQPPATHGARMSFEQARAAAADTIQKDPMAGQKLVEELDAKPRAPSPTEDALLLHEQTRLKNERIQAEDQLIEAQKSANPEAVAEAKRRVEQATADFARIADVVTKAGTESSLSLGHRRMMMREDFSLAAMERAEQVSNDGKPLTDAQRAEVKALYEEKQATQKAFDDYVSRSQAIDAERESKLAHTRLVIEAAKSPTIEPQVKSLVDRVVAAMENEANAARIRIKQKAGRLAAGVDPTLIADMAIVGAAKLARGALDFTRFSKAMIEDLGQTIEPFLQAAWEASQQRLDEFVQRRVPRQQIEKVSRVLKQEGVVEQREAIKEQIRARVESGNANDIGGLAQRLARGFIEQGVNERGALIDAVHGELKGVLPEMTRREAMDAISGYGKFSQLSKDQISVELRDLKGQMQQVAKLEDIESKKPPLKTGVERRAVSDEERRLIQNVNEAKRRHGIVSTDPARQLQTALGAIKTRLRNSISDLEYQIANRQKIVQQKTDAPLDAEATELRVRRDDLKKQFTEIFGKPEMTDAQRVRLATGALERSIADLNQRIETGDIAPGREPSKTPVTPEIEALRKQRAALQERLARMRRSSVILGRDPFARQAHARVEKSIADLARRIKERDIAPRRPRVEPVSTPALEEARAYRDAMQEQLQEIRDLANPKKAPDEIALQSLKTRLKNRTAELERRMQEGDFAPRQRREIALDDEAKRLQFKDAEVTRRWNERLFKHQLANRTVPEKILGTAGEVLNASRAVITSLDLSAVLRQGGFIALGHPFRAARAMPDMFRALRKQGEHQVMQEIQNRPNYPLYKRSKLYLSEPAQTLAAMEEAYMSRWAEKIPLVGASQRAYTTFLNRLRADSFDTMVNSLTKDGKPTPVEANAIANYVNVATGRGNLGQKSQALVGLNTVFFAPRYVASRFQLVAGQPLYGGTARTRKMIAKEYARYLAGIASVYALGQLAGAEIEADPRSSDFGKLRFGDTRVDPLSGLAQVTTLVGRLATGETKRLSGKVVPIRGEKVPYGADDSADVIARFLRTKLSPAFGAGVDILSGENVIGEKVTPGSVATNLATPLAFRDIYEAMIDQGVPRGTALGILSIFGFGLQTYEPRQAAGGSQ